jgi:hypothetical protein
MALAVVSAALGLACGGRAVRLTGAAGASGTGAAGTSAVNMTGAAGTGGAAGAQGGNDPGFVGWRVLSNREYANTIRDLLGVRSAALETFHPSGYWEDFGAVIYAPRFEQYFNEAERLATMVFAEPSLRNRIAACPSASPGSGECLRVALANLGQRAWRRPLTGAEADALNALAQTAMAEEGFDGALRRGLTGLLTSAPFLHRIELDPAPTSLAPHALTPWELASRLSYLAWSTMPDERLFSLAADGMLAREDVLAAEVDRLLADKRADELIDAFVLDWLFVATLKRHAVEPATFPTWNAGLGAAMVDEAHLYVAEFLRSDRSFATFPEADFNFVNAELAGHYGFPTSGMGTDLRRVEVTTDRRRGFLGLGAFLTATSYSYRTSPTLRGKAVMEQLLCETIAPPPADVAQLMDSPQRPITQSLRERLEQHDKDKACASCHVFMDQIGFAFEEHDAVGKYRATYADGTRVDASGTLYDSAKVGPNGELPPGKPFDGEPELASLIGRDQRFLDCTSRKTLSYALGRELRDADASVVAGIRGAWVNQGTTLRGLIKRIVLDDTFRTRRAEGKQ